MFGVVICPFCSNVQGIGYPIERSRCKRCGRTINILKNEPVRVFKDQKEMRAFIRVMKLRGKKKMDSLIVEECIYDKKDIKKRSGGLDLQILDILSDRDLSMEDLKVHFSNKGIDGEELIEIMEKMRIRGDIILTNKGTYRKVD